VGRDGSRGAGSQAGGSFVGPEVYTAISIQLVVVLSTYRWGSSTSLAVTWQGLGVGCSA